MNKMVKIGWGGRGAYVTNCTYCPTPTGDRS